MTYGVFSLSGTGTGTGNGLNDVVQKYSHCNVIGNNKQYKEWGSWLMVSKPIVTMLAPGNWF